MTTAEFQERLDAIAKNARAQATGPYTAQSDAVSALYMIESLAHLLISESKARGEDHVKPENQP